MSHFTSTCHLSLFSSCTFRICCMSLRQKISSFPLPKVRFFSISSLNEFIPCHTADCVLSFPKFRIFSLNFSILTSTSIYNIPCHLTAYCSRYSHIWISLSSLLLSSLLIFVSVSLLLVGITVCVQSSWTTEIDAKSCFFGIPWPLQRFMFLPSWQSAN